MISFARTIRLGFACLTLCAWSACSPKPETEADEQKERHYLSGRRRLAAMDYDGALEAFEQAVIANPRSASAHFELGVLCEQRLFDYAAAIYHYERALRLRPDLPQAANIRPRIKACKVELADKEALVPVNAAVQKDLDRFATENARLRQQVSQLLNQIRQSSNRPLPAPGTLQGGHASLTNSNSAFPSPLLTTNPPLPVPNVPPSSTSSILIPPRSLIKPPLSTNAALTRKTRHVVKPGESAYSIARSYGLSVSALLQANPALEPRKLRPGHVLIVPAP